MRNSWFCPSKTWNSHQVSNARIHFSPATAKPHSMVLSKAGSCNPEFQFNFNGYSSQTCFPYLRSISRMDSISHRQSAEIAWRGPCSLLDSRFFLTHWIFEMVKTKNIQFQSKTNRRRSWTDFVETENCKQFHWVKRILKDINSGNLMFKQRILGIHSMVGPSQHDKQSFSQLATSNLESIRVRREGWEIDMAVERPRKDRSVTD